MTSEHEKDPERVAAGLKAAMHNPHVSQSAKEHARAQLQELEERVGRSFTSHQPAKGSSSAAGTHGRHTRSSGDSELQPQTSETSAPEEKEKDEGHRLAGYKAVLHSTLSSLGGRRIITPAYLDPNTSESAKQNARQVLESHGVSYEQ
ncbi:hypothetical protein AX16_004706 [Volvariella volvacea WC 439]|nr:hypothetical protein AX16_004706 [Volvariella volvacea WC 439]